MSDVFFENISIHDKVRQYISKGKVTSQDTKPIQKIKAMGDHIQDYEIYSSEEDIDDINSLSTSGIEDLQNSTTYYYLDHDNGSLHYDFGLLEEADDVTKDYVIHLCCFKINELGPYPFIMYLLQLDGEVFKFPQFQFRSSSTIEIDEEETEMTPRHMEFQNECMKRVLEFIKLDRNQGDIDKIYKGFMEEKYGNINHLYAFFDISEFELVSKISPLRREWATIDELAFRNNLLGYKIDDHITSMFSKNESIQYISKNRSENMKTPIIMYLCKANENGTYENLYYDDDEVHFDRSIKDYSKNPESSLQENSPKEEYFTLLHDRIAHPILGNFYILSIKPLDLITKSIFKIKRFVGFILQPIHILKNLSGTVQENEVKKDFTLGMVIPSVVDYFAKPEDVTNPEKTESSDEIVPESTLKNGNHNFSGFSPKEFNEPKGLESTFQNGKPDISRNLPKVDGELEDLGPENFEKEEVQNEKLSGSSQQNLKDILDEIEVTCVYFQDYVNGKRCAFWSIRSDDDFIEIL